MTNTRELSHFSPPLVCLFAVAFFLVCLATLIIYWPGLAGIFLLDDIPNLKSLNQNLTVETTERLKQFVLGGSSGPTGRPLSLLSFLVNDFGWPSEAKTFKYTNVFIHLLNGALITWLFVLLLSLRANLSRQHVILISTTLAAFWLLHPSQVSTTLYVVQRMNMLATLFVLAGLVCYVKWRCMERPNYILMSAGISVAGILGVLCKENTILLPLLIIVVEYTLIRTAGLTSTRKWRIWATIFLFVPVALLIGWHIFNFEGIHRSYISREFSLIERLLTQPRVLVDYAFNIIIPVRTGTGVFGDDFTISTSIFRPYSTVIALFGLFVSLSIAIIFRKRIPIFSFAILWFVAGHSLEAGIIPLEIYFEHRNYLPMVGPLFGIVYGLYHLPTKINRIGIATTLGLIAISSLATWQNTTLWGNPALQSQVWAEEHPKSIRAQQFAADYWFKSGLLSEAEKYIQQIVDTKPETISAHLTLVQIKCLQGIPHTNKVHNHYLNIVSKGNFDLAVPEVVANIMQLHFINKCKGFTKQKLTDFFDLLLANPNLKDGKTRAELYYRQSIFFQAYGELDNGIDALENAIRYDNNVDLALVQANMYIALQDYENALKAVSKAENMDRNGPLKIRLRTDELREWHDFIVAKIEKKKQEE